MKDLVIIGCSLENLISSGNIKKFFPWILLKRSFKLNRIA